MSLDHYVLHPVPVEQRERWDQFIAQHPNGHLLQSWGGGERKVATVNALRYVIAQEPPRSGHFAYIPKGPVLDWSQPLQCNALFSQLCTLLRARDVLTLRVELSQVAGMAGSEL